MRRMFQRVSAAEPNAYDFCVLVALLMVLFVAAEIGLLGTLRSTGVTASDTRYGSNLLMIGSSLAIFATYLSVWWRNRSHASPMSFQLMGLLQFHVALVGHRFWWLPYSADVADGGDGSYWLTNSFPHIDFLSLFIASGACFHCHHYLERIAGRFWWFAGMFFCAVLYIGGTLASYALRL